MVWFTKSLQKLTLNRIRRKTEVHLVCFYLHHIPLPPSTPTSTSNLSLHHAHPPPHPYSYKLVGDDRITNPPFQNLTATTAMTSAGGHTAFWITALITILGPTLEGKTSWWFTVTFELQRHQSLPCFVFDFHRGRNVHLEWAKHPIPTSQTYSTESGQHLSPESKSSQISWQLLPALWFQLLSPPWKHHQPPGVVVLCVLQWTGSTGNPPDLLLHQASCEFLESEEAWSLF